MNKDMCCVDGCAAPRFNRRVPQCETHMPKCGFDGCDRKARVKGWCHPHYDNVHAHGSPEPRPRRTRKPCTVDGCTNLAMAKDLCPTHYARFRERGTTDPALTTKPLCAVDDCDRFIYSRGWCERHYWSFRKYGDPLTAETRSRKRAERLPEMTEETEETRRCTGCQRLLHVSGYYAKSGRTGQVTGRCKDCIRDKYNDRYATDPAFREMRAGYNVEFFADDERRKQHRTRSAESKFKAMYGITFAEYDEMNAAQGGLCAICHEPPYEGRRDARKQRLAVDHAHDATRRIRGLLCDRCNTGLGMFRDRPDLLLAAVEYLKRTSPDVVSTLF